MHISSYRGAALVAALTLGCGDESSQTDAGACPDSGECSADATAWGPGDYPPELNEQTYLPIEGVPGQQGNVRGYKVHVPPGYDAETPAPLVFAMHGLSQNPVMFAIDGADWPAKADEEGFVLVMPTGNVQRADGTWATSGSWNGGECCGAAASEELDDVALIRAIAEEVGTHLNIDSSRVYATGLSTGGFLSYRLACEASDLIVAIAPGAGAIGSPDIAPMGVGNENFTECAPDEAVSVLAMHGSADPLVPYEYVEPSLAHMARENGCADTTVAATFPASEGDTTCVTYEGCPDGVEVTGCTVDGGGHCWFGNATCGTGDTTGIGLAVVGANSDTLVSTDAAWGFFERVRR